MPAPRRLARLAPRAPRALLVVAAFLPVARFGFLGFDDDRHVPANAHVGAGLTAAGARWALTTTFDGNRFPLTWLSHMLDAP